MSNPFGQIGDLFGSADGRIDLNLNALIQEAAILIGHVGAVVVAFAILFVMVAYSSIDLWLLLSS